MKLMQALGAGEVGQPISTPAEVYQFRRWRDAHAPGSYFGEPGWDILLRAWIAREQFTSITAEDLRLEIAVPESAFALVMERMVADGMIVLAENPSGAHRVELTERGGTFIQSVFHFMLRAHQAPTPDAAPASRVPWLARLLGRRRGE